MLAVPASTAVARPLELTVATDVLVLVQAAEVTMVGDRILP